MKELKVLIAPWGDPINWQKVKYKFGDDELEGWDTVPILVDNIGVEDVIFVVSDTLLNSVIGIAKGDKWFLDRLEKRFDSEQKENIIKQSADAWDKLSYSIRNSIATNEIYGLICDAVKSYTKIFIDKYVNSLIKNGRLKERIFVEFGTGRFKYLESIGNPVDFYYSFLSDLAKYLISKNVLSYGQLTIYLDTTHGINYFTIMTYKAVRVIASLLANLIDVRVVTYNADPFVPGADVTKPLFINETENILAEPYTSIYYSKEPEGKKVKKTLYFLVASKFLMPILMLYFIPDFDLDQSIHNAKNKTIRKLSINQSDKLIIKREHELPKEVELFMKAYLWVHIVGFIINDYYNFGADIEEIKRIAIEGVDIKLLRNFIEKIRNPLSHIAIVELEQIVKRKRFDIPKDKNGQIDLKKFKRNLVAHSGFLVSNAERAATTSGELTKLRLLDNGNILRIVRELLLELSTYQ